MVYEEPSCKGSESSLLECAWSTIQVGSGVCDYHNDIGIQCLPVLEKPSSHWRGLKFENAPTKRILLKDNTNYQAISMSELRYVDIKKAGSGRRSQVNAAIDVIGIPPVMNHIQIDQSAYTGINVTRPDAAFQLKEVSVQRSHGIGIFINSSYGLAHLQNIAVTESGSDGILYVGHDLRSDERTDRGNIHDFCTIPTTAGQTYPISMSIQQSRFAVSSKECGKYFFTQNDYVLTLSFTYFTVTRNDSGVIDVFDGSSTNDRLLGSWSIRNSTRPQSLTSTQNKIFIRYRADARSDVLGFLRITTGYGKSYDLNVTNGYISDNEGRGINIRNLRSQLYVDKTDITNNGAGILVNNGAGDINITNSKISFNRGDGINITYYGGNRNISKSSISSNLGYGIAVWLNETTKDRQEFSQFNQTTTVEYSKLFDNVETTFFHGNFSKDYWVNITGNTFNETKNNAINIQTCWFDYNPEEKLRLQIGHNIFHSIKRIGIVISPALNLDGKIEYNHFKYGSYGQILIKNKLLEEFHHLPVRLIVQHNHFLQNHGQFVVSLGLSAYSDKSIQHLLFTRNFIQNNRIKEPFNPSDEEGEGPFGENRLNPRSRVAAPVVISSDNVDVFRNIISNPQSKYEVGSQLSDQSKILNVTFNWLGNSDEEKIFYRLFHRKDRYNLAKIEYLPYLLHNSNPGSNVIMKNPTFVPQFHIEGSDKLGGEVDGLESLPSGSYTVERDINIRPGGKLILQSGVKLNFVPNVGIMVAGKLEARGKSPNDIMFTLKREPIMTLENETTELLGELSDMIVDSETEPGMIPDENLNTFIRLVGGVNEHEGLLQVKINGKWGTVCDYGWDVIDAALACHQMGLALNPIDWRLDRNEVPSAGSDDMILLSNVRCTDDDIDILKCRSEKYSKGEFENSCTHENDVGIRCYPGAWAGLRFGVLSESTELQYITVEHAGLFDYVTNKFKPAIQFDFSKHNMENVRVIKNLHDGLGILYSDIYSNNVNNIKNSEFTENRGNGISIKQLGLRIHGSIIRDNLGSGIHHDSVISSEEQREISGWFNRVPDFALQDFDYHPIELPESKITHIQIDQWAPKYLITNRYSGESIENEISIVCPPRYVVGIQLLNPITNRSTEEILIYDSQNGNPKSDIWNVTRDISVFPTTSSSYGIILKYKSGVNALGGVVFILSAVPAPEQNIKNRIVKGPIPNLQITSSKIQKNTRGISATYYNRYLGDLGEHYLRKANESIKILNCELSLNVIEAIFINSPFWDVHTSNISEITLHINRTTIQNNGRGIHQFAKDLRSSNNLFHYVMQDDIIENNGLGGFQLSLPYVWQYNENFTHSVYIGIN